MSGETLVAQPPQVSKACGTTQISRDIYYRITVLSDEGQTEQAMAGLLADARVQAAAKSAQRSARARKRERSEGDATLLSCVCKMPHW